MSMIEGEKEGIEIGVAVALTAVFALFEYLETTSPIVRLLQGNSSRSPSSPSFPLLQSGRTTAPAYCCCCSCCCGRPELLRSAVAAPAVAPLPRAAAAGGNGPSLSLNDGKADAFSVTTAKTEGGAGKAEAEEEEEKTFGWCLTRVSPVLLSLLLLLVVVLLLPFLEKA